MKNSLATLFISVAIITSFWIAGNAYKYKFKTNETISVTGLADKEFISDQIIWRGDYSRKNLDLKTAYIQLKDDEVKIREYLKEKGLTDTEMVFSSVSIQKEFKERYNAEGTSIGSDFSGVKGSSETWARKAGSQRNFLLRRETVFDSFEKEG